MRHRATTDDAFARVQAIPNPVANLMQKLSFTIGLAALVVLLLARGAQADPVSYTASEAMRAVESGRMLLIDVRTPQEWKDTGVAQGAVPLDLKNKEFAKRLTRVLEDNPNRQVAFICATGMRSLYVAQALEENGFPQMGDVAEGMLGSRAGPGWLKSGLPVVSLDEAQRLLPADLQAQ